MFVGAVVHVHVQVVLGQSALLVGIKDHEVGVGADGDSALAGPQAKQPGRGGGHQFHEFVDREAALDAGMPLNRVLLVDGGAKSPLWRSIIANVTGMSMHYIPGVVGAPLGDALLAGVGCGALSYESIKDWVKIEEKVEPSPARKAIYDKYYKIFKKLYGSVKEVFKEWG
ncbi:TPA: hypothetical protein EYP26_01880 [Candidatus Bathyarchaeota archaeon]|nr:hypothetical protein [Candidatus Bathyarchaeota archaeon]